MGDGKQCFMLVGEIGVLLTSLPLAVFPSAIDIKRKLTN